MVHNNEKIVEMETEFSVERAVHGKKQVLGQAYQKKK